jgi:epoxyqueuosine reductase
MEKSTFPNVKEIIKARAYHLGFCLCGITHLAPPVDYPRYQNWIQQGLHGKMSYLASEYHTRVRQNPQELAPWAKSLILFAWPYPLNPDTLNQPGGLVAGYVGQRDYHKVLPSILNQLIQETQKETGLSFQFKIVTDSAPVLERELASRAGLGWIGKNSCLISPKVGSAFLLAEVFVEIELEPDTPFTSDHCGTCQRCIEACPTQCIQPDRTLDASRCISTLTIENKGEIPEALLPAIGNHLFGCDVCQTVCPWNRFAQPAGEPPSYSSKQMVEMLEMDELTFHHKFQDHPISRAKHTGWLRNLCAVLGNLKVREALIPLKRLEQTSESILVKSSVQAAINRIKE